jgi:hypothetical protein
MMTDKNFSKKPVKARRKKEELKLVTSDGREFYATNSELLKELKLWRASSPDPNERIISEKLALIMMSIAKHITNHSFFRNYPKEMKEDLVGQALYKMVSGIHHYKFKYTNPFAYFSQICFNSGKAICANHYKQLNIKKKYYKDKVHEMEDEDCLSPNSVMLHYFDNIY